MANSASSVSSKGSAALLAMSRRTTSTGGDRTQDDGDKPALVKTAAKGVVAPQGRWGLVEIAFAREGESYLISEGDRVGGLHGYSGTRTLRYSTVLRRLCSIFPELAHEAICSLALTSPSCTSRHPQFDH